MILIKKLYTEPQYFEPIIFDYGVNLIIGDKSDENNKTNGVGKSICVELINFCLLKDSKHSRIMKIPKQTMPLDVKIILELKIHEYELKIIRNRENPETVFITKDTEEIEFINIRDATDFLKNLFFEKVEKIKKNPSFRKILSPIIRDERSEFKNLINTFDTKKRIPLDFVPHLYFFDIDIYIYETYKKTLKDIDSQTKFIKELKIQITENGNLNLKDVRSKLNNLEDQVKKLNKAIKEFKTNDAFQSIQKDLINLERDLENLRLRQKLKKYEIQQIESLPKPETISKKEVSILYNEFKDGLGDLLSKSLKEMEIFKSKIDNFRQNIVNKKLTVLKEEVSFLGKEIAKKDTAYSEKLKMIDKNGKVLKDLKSAFMISSQKNEELNRITSLVLSYDKAIKNRKKILQPELNKLKLQIEEEIDKRKNIKDSFERTVLNIHDYIMNNKNASFNIETKNTKNYVSFEMEVDSGGSYSIERLKVLFYDIALMFNEHTKKQHPKLLIHDNIFNVDQDTLIKSLNYLAKKEEQNPHEFQYILTLNRDKIENEERQSLIKLDINQHRKVNLTKENPLFGIKYKENK